MKCAGGQWPIAFVRHLTSARLMLVPAKVSDPACSLPFLQLRQHRVSIRAGTRHTDFTAAIG